MLRLEQRTSTDRPRNVDRSSDRLITLAAIGLAVAFLMAALVATSLPSEVRQGSWLPLHLALAGGATTAIAGVMPFFAAAFAAAPPTDARLRGAAVAAVALGALAVAVGIAFGPPVAALLGGLAYLVGIVLVGIATARPAHRGLGPRGGSIRVAYLVALAELAVGASLAILLLADLRPAVDEWTRWKPAHAWLNVVGFVSLVIATTLLHFFPTVVGARLAAHRSASLVVAGLAAGPPLVALGYVLGADVLARTGAVLAAVGSLALAVYAARIWRARARWTSDAGWHRFVMGGLVSAIAWLEIGMLLAAGRVVVHAAAPESWSLEPVAGPLVMGWAAISVVASATHLVPAVGPGDHAAHARQRVLLGRGASFRLALLDGGTAMLTVGSMFDLDAATVLGVLLAASGLAGSAALLVMAAGIGVRGRNGSPGIMPSSG